MSFPLVVKANEKVNRNFCYAVITLFDCVFLQACKLAIRESIEADIRKEREREANAETDMVRVRKI